MFLFVYYPQRNELSKKKVSTHIDFCVVLERFKWKKRHLINAAKRSSRKIVQLSGMKLATKRLTLWASVKKKNAFHDIIFAGSARKKNYQVWITNNVDDEKVKTFPNGNQRVSYI